jgi:hypothetical protein
MTHIRVQARAQAPLETTWSVLADRAGMAARAQARKVTREREGDPPPGGVGAIRVVSQPPLTVREQITDVNEPVRLACRPLSGLPVRSYAGEAILSDGDGGTDIVWTVTMTPRFPGITFVVRRAIRALAAQSQRIGAREGRNR